MAGILHEKGRRERKRRNLLKTPLEFGFWGEMNRIGPGNELKRGVTRVAGVIEVRDLEVVPMGAIILKKSDLFPGRPTGLFEAEA
jgi:hypothetical protein